MRVLIHSFVPLMIVKVITHLSNSLGSRGLVFHWDPCNARSYIKLNMVSFQYVLILFIDFYHFIPFNSLIIVAFNWPSFYLVELLFYPVNSIVGIIFWLLFLIFLRFLGRRWWGWWLGSNFYIIGWKKPKLLRFTNNISKPPPILISLPDQNFVPCLKVQIFYILISLLLLLFSFLLIILALIVSLKLSVLLFSSISFL